MDIEDIQASRRPARDLLIGALTAREAFQSPVVAGQADVYRSRPVGVPGPIAVTGIAGSSRIAMVG